jgi:hypothetical protein
MVIVIGLDIPAIFTQTIEPRKFKSMMYHTTDIHTRNVVVVVVVFNTPRCEIHKLYMTRVSQPQIRKRFFVAINIERIPVL